MSGIIIAKIVLHNSSVSETEYTLLLNNIGSF